MSSSPKWMGRVRVYARLVRLPNVLTAAADPMAGWWFVRSLSAGEAAAAAVWPLMAASMLIYAGGIILNDLADLEEDRRERPHRPLPSGQLPVMRALVLAIACFGMGMSLMLVSGSFKSVLVGTLLIAAVLSYDLGGKRTAWGPGLMGLCRGLNLALGMSHAAEGGGWAGWSVCALFGLFVAGFTWISRDETRVGHTEGLALGTLTQVIALGWLLYFWVVAALTGRVANLAAHFGGSLSALGLTILVMALVLQVNWRAWRQPDPTRMQEAVVTAILSLVLLDAAIAGVGSGWIASASVVLIFPLARRLGQTIAAT